MFINFFVAINIHLFIYLLFILLLWNGSQATLLTYTRRSPTPPHFTRERCDSKIYIGSSDHHWPLFAERCSSNPEWFTHGGFFLEIYRRAGYHNPQCHFMTSLFLSLSQPIWWRSDFWMVYTTKYLHIYVEYRAVSGVFQTIDPPPLSNQRVLGGRGTHLPGGEGVVGVGVNSSEDARQTLASYGIIPLRFTRLMVLYRAKVEWKWEGGR